MISKHDVRKSKLCARLDQKPEVVHSKTKKINREVWNLIEYFKPDILLSYMAFGSEIHIGNVMDKAIKLGIEIYIPRVEGKNMSFYRYYGKESTSSGFKGILEPDNQERFIYDPSDALKVLMIMPGVAFDIDRGRVGYGGGFYDRYLQDKKGILTAAICYDCQLSDELIELEPTDIRPDIVITEERVLSSGVIKIKNEDIKNDDIGNEEGGYYVRSYQFIRESKDSLS